MSDTGPPDGLEERLRRALRDRAERVVPARPEWHHVAARIAERRSSRRRTAFSGLGVVVAAAAALLAFVVAGSPASHRVKVVAPASSPSSLSQGSHSSSVRSSPQTVPSEAPSTTATTEPGPPGGPVPAGFQPASATWVSPSEGWVLGTAPCSAPPCTSVVRTFDGGSSWQGIPAPVDALASSPYARAGVSRIRFASPLDGWAFGPDLWSTHDGGQTWNQLELPGRVLDLEAANGAAFAVVAGGSGHSTFLYEAKVGSDSWRQLPAPEPLLSTASIALSGSGGYVFGADGAVLQISTSGLRRAGSPCAAGSAPVALSPTPTRLYALCASNGAAGSSGKELLVSTDEGNTWSRAGSAPLHGQPTALGAATGGTVVVAAIGGAGWLYRSSDGGATWSTVYRTAGGAPITDLGFTTPDQGIAIVGQAGRGSELLMTFDAGATWRPVSF